MNKKTFAVALLFFCASIAWFVVNIYWFLKGICPGSGLVIPSLFLIAGIAMMYNEFNKKKRRHLADVDKNRIP